MRQEAFAGEPGGWQQTLSFQHRAVALATNLSLGPGSEADGPFPECRGYSRQEQVFSALCPVPCTALAAPCQPPGHPDPGHRGGSCLLAKGSRPQGQPSVAAQHGRSSGCLLQEGVKSNCFLPKRQLPLADQTASAGLLAASSPPRLRARGRAQIQPCSLGAPAPGRVGPAAHKCLTQLKTGHKTSGAASHCRASGRCLHLGVSVPGCSSAGHRRKGRRLTSGLQRPHVLSWPRHEL